MCFLTFHQLDRFRAQYLCCSLDTLIADRCRICDLNRSISLVMSMSRASMPKLHHNVSLKRLFIGWLTPLRFVAKGAIVKLELGAPCVDVTANEDVMEGVTALPSRCRSCSGMPFSRLGNAIAFVSV